jgi:protein phosphatase 1 regulatory subunit 7
LISRFDPFDAYTNVDQDSMLNRTLDLSFNNIRHVPNLPSKKQVNTLYLVQNKVAEVGEGELDWAAGSMKSLELGGNRLRVSV